MHTTSGLTEATPEPEDLARPTFESDGESGGAFSLETYLGECRELALKEIQRFIPSGPAARHAPSLYEMMIEYPMRPAKALRPALCIGTCLALGGNLDGVLPSAAAFELFHNAFLVHDDVEDGSVLRRHGPTLHEKYGVPMAVNVGDGMLALALEPLLDNVRALGLGPGLRILRSFSRMARESVEGQTMELEWIRERRWDITDREYLRMVHKKTGWYSFIAPIEVGALAAGVAPEVIQPLRRFALLLGIAFQIQDDLLSLEGTEAAMGKDALGDLFEGKYTLSLLHALRVMPAGERQEALELLALPRPRDAAPGARARGAEEVRRLHTLVVGPSATNLRHAREVARRHAARARAIFTRNLARMDESVHRRFLSSLIDFVIHRTH